MALTARKAAELAHRLRSLSAELDAWRAATDDGGRLEKHFSQVEAVATEIAVPIEALRARIDGLDGAAALEEAAAIEDVIAELHRLWDMFRGRLTLRYVDRFAPYLLGADELAYRCYRPAEQRGAGHEPPLVAFADEVSPVMRPRGVELRPADALSPLDPLGEALRRLPVALIDLPWSLVEHLPGAPIIAHEVGHDVEAYLGLGADMQAALDAALDQTGVPPSHRRAWTAWRQEAFADVFGTLCLGPAFTSALIDFLAAAPNRVAVEWQGDPDWAAHPPSTLRIHLSAAVLAAASGLATEAAALRGLWTSAYPSHEMSEFEREVEAVAGAIVAGPYQAFGSGPLTELISFGAGSHANAVRDARELLRNRPAERSDARALVAAARLAFDADPDRYDEREVSRRVLHRIAERQTAGRRAGKQGADLAALASRATTAGWWLERHLASAHGLEPFHPEGETHVQAQQ